MIEKNVLYSIGEIIKMAELPVLIRRPTFNLDFFVEIHSVKNGVAYGEGFKGTKATGKQYSYELYKHAFFCEWKDLVEIENLINNPASIPYHLPKRADSYFHEYHDDTVPPYVPGKTILPVKRGENWVNAVFTGFEKRNEKILVYSFYDEKELFCRLEGNLIQAPIPLKEAGFQTQKAYESLRGRTTRKEDIVDFLILDRGIQYLIHFTPIDNLNSIFEKGIVPRSYLDENDDIVVTDIVRLDDCLDCSCFSLSFPNYQMLYRKRDETGRKFAILLIDISALLNPNVNRAYYLPVNAAYNELQQNIKSYYQLQDAINMFADTLEYKGVVYHRDKLDIPKEYTTSPQAEVMIEGIVPTPYIRAVIFPDQMTKSAAEAMVRQRPNDTIFKVDPSWFSMRQDAKHWKKGLV